MNSIFNEAFRGCSTTLTTIHFNDTLEVIHCQAFANCTSLTKIVFGTNLRQISNEAFIGCTALPRVSFNKALQIICDGAFRGCSQLEHVRLGPNLKKLGNGAFYEAANTLRIEYAGCCLPVAIRLACAYPKRQIPELTLERRVFLYAFRPIGDQNLLQSKEEGESAELESRLLDEIRRAHREASQNLLLWLTR